MGKWWWRLMYWAERLVYKKSAQLFFISGDDLKAAIGIFDLDPSRCTEVAYGTYLKSPPNGHVEARSRVVARHGLDEKKFLILFFGPLSYQPNMEAVSTIVDHIAPLLKHKADFSFKFLICGGGLPTEKKGWIEGNNVAYLGFVKDIKEYVEAVDLVINPVTTGGGVKTKIVEAIALDTTVLSSISGAVGMNISVCGEKLIEVPDNDIEAFSDGIICCYKKATSKTPNYFYEYYFWGNTIQGAVDVLNSITNDDT